MSDQEAVLIYTTWPNADLAVAAGEQLLARRTVACVNILAPATAIYMWQGKTEHGQEVPMLIKTVRRHVDNVVAEINHLHPYDVPAVAAVPIVDGNAAFLEWIGCQTVVPS